MSDIDFGVIFADFTKDAAQWRTASAAVGSASKSAQGVDEIPYAVTDGVSYAAGFKSSYEELAQWTQAHLANGSAALEGIAARLDQTAKEYRESDEYAQWQAHNG